MQARRASGKMASPTEEATDMIDGIKHDLRTLAHNVRTGDPDTYCLTAAIVIGLLGLWLA